MKRINLPIISWCDIPDDDKPSWLGEFMNGCYVPYTLEAEGDALSDWIRNNHPELAEENEVLIDIDY